MRVDELSDYAKLHPTSIERVQAKELILSGDSVEVNGRSFGFEDSETLGAVGKFFKVPVTFLKRIPPELVEQNLRYFLDFDPDRWLAFEHDNSEVYTVHDGSVQLLSRQDFVGVVESVFDADDDVVSAAFHQGLVKIDVVTEQLEVEPRPGDITRGGVRITGHQAVSTKKPEVQAFLERLTCANGNTIKEPVGTVSIQGRTLDEILQEMELACVRVLRHVPVRMESWEKMATQQVADVAQMVHRLLSESAVPAQLESRIIDRLPEIEGDTLYDVVNLITGSWDLEGVEDRHVERLQAAGGHAIATASQHRCPNCLSALGV